MKVVLSIKGSSVELSLPPERTIAWLVQAALLWLQQTKGTSVKEGKCQARKAGGDILPPSAQIKTVLRQNQTVNVLLPQDIAFLGMGR